MTRNVSMWSKLQLEEYMSKANKNETNFNTNSVSNNSGYCIYENITAPRPSLITRMPSEVESFYSLPGIPLSDAIPTDNYQYIDITNNSRNKSELNTTVVENVEKLEKKVSRSEENNLNMQKVNHQKTNSYEASNSRKNESKCNSGNSFINTQVSYARAADNLKAFLETNKLAKDMALNSFYSKFQTKRVSQCEKAIQTSQNDLMDGKVTMKMHDKANQTRLIVTRNRSASTDFSSQSEYIQTNKGDLQKKSENRIHKTKLPFSGVKKIALKKQNSDIKNRPKKISNNGLSSNFTTRSHCDDSLNNDSYLEEVTVLSKPTLPFSPVNNLFENCGINLDYSSDGVNPNSDHGASFWDNLLDRSDADKSIHAGKPTISILNTKTEYVGKLSGDNTNTLSIASKSSTKRPNGDFSDIRQSKYKEFHSPKSKTPNSISERIYNCDYNHQRRLEFSQESKFSRIFYLHRYDDLVKSHFCPSDRRIKSVSAKNGCSITIDGPINSLDNHLPNHPSKTKVIYRCTVSGNNQEDLDKCLNYLKETFPNTCLRSGIKNVLK